MNERQATMEGLSFTGVCADPWDKDEMVRIKNRAAEIRKSGYRAVIVQSGKHEWGCGSKVLYAEKGWHTYEWLKENEKRSAEQSIIKYAEEQCRKIMEKAIKEQQELDERIAEAREQVLKHAQNKEENK